MLTNVLRFVVSLLLALLVGTMFGIWLGYNPAALSAASYIEQQQNAIRALNTLLPALGAVSIVLTVTLAALRKEDRVRRYLLAVAAACLLAAGIITRFGNQPVNSIVMTWNAASPPSDWQELRDTWWYWHVLRTAAGICGLALVQLATIDWKDGKR